MKTYQESLAALLAETQALFFQDGLTLKDGRPTPYFVNFGLFRAGRSISALGEIMADYLVDKGLHEGFDVLIGPSYKGSALAVSTVEALWLKHRIDRGFDYDRKEAKTHGEASRTSTRFVTGALTDNCRVLIVDDVITTMTTKFEILRQLAEEATDRGQSYHPQGVVLFLDREQTTAVYDQDKQPVLGRKGQDAAENFRTITGLPVEAILGIRAAIDFLRREKLPVLQNGRLEPLTEASLAAFRDYLAVYGLG
jgi:orotate phosphoribosyltransferase